MKGPREFNCYHLPLKAERPDKPESLPPGAQKEWDRVVDQLDPLNVLCNLDIASVAQYASCTRN